MSKHKRSESSSHQEEMDKNLKHPPTKVAKKIDAHTPLTQLQELLSQQKTVPKEGLKTVLHWFRSKDLRMQDNKGLHSASQLAHQHNVPLITCYLYSPADMEWHGTSPARCDFLLTSLKLLRSDLKGKNIPLSIIIAKERGEKVDDMEKFIRENDVSHVFCNYEYEVDELRRDIKMVKRLSEKNSSNKKEGEEGEGEGEVEMQLFHDQTAMEPGILVTGSNTPHKVFTPYHKSWLSEVTSDPSLIDTLPEPHDNSQKAITEEKIKKLFDNTEIPGLPEGKGFSSVDEEKRIRKLWPAGHEAGMTRLHEFLSKKVKNYAVQRVNPAKDCTSRLSPYFAAGIISVREALTAAKKANGNSADFSESSGDKGIAAWVREVVFREFYRQMLTTLPHNSMNLPQNLKFDFVEWEKDEEGWKKWYEGMTGVPFVDAGMRQLNTEAYMHNRLRMNTSSYLRTNLLIDYRRGERYFAEHLIDWDLANNTQGWEPSYTVFNPVSQAERNDPQGEYIRKWVPELRNVEGKAVFDPYGRLSEEEFNKLGYPKPHVDFKESKDRALSRYKSDLADADP